MGKDNCYTDSGIEIKKVYYSVPTTQIKEEPGEFPYTRGVQPDMYRGKLWTMRQYAGFSTAEESNKRYHFLLSQGVMGLSVAFDLPTQIGYDSDHSLSEGEVGKVGVAIDSIEDMETLFAGINLEQVVASLNNANVKYTLDAVEDTAGVAFMRNKEKAINRLCSILSRHSIVNLRECILMGFEGIRGEVEERMRLRRQHHKN